MVLKKYHKQFVCNRTGNWGGQGGPTIKMLRLVLSSFQSDPDRVGFGFSWFWVYTGNHHTHADF